MPKICPLCGTKIGLFSGKFIREKYVCKACYELSLKEGSTDSRDGERDQDEHSAALLPEAFARAYKYKPWSWGKKKENK